MLQDGNDHGESKTTKHPPQPPSEAEQRQMLIVRILEACKCSDGQSLGVALEENEKVRKRVQALQENVDSVNYASGVLQDHCDDDTTLTTRFKNPATFFQLDHDLGNMLFSTIMRLLGEHTYQGCTREEFIEMFGLQDRDDAMAKYDEMVERDVAAGRCR